jgi:hypothetical protein
MTKTITKFSYIIFAASRIFFGFLGACLLFLGDNYFAPLKNTNNAVDIASTYIIFTTLIFVGMAALIGIFGFVFSQQFSQSKDDHLNVAFGDLARKLENTTDEKEIKYMIDAITGNESIINRLSATIDKKVVEIILNKAKQEVEKSKSSISHAKTLMKSVKGERNGEKL